MDETKILNNRGKITSLIEGFNSLSRDKIDYLKSLDKPTIGWFSTYTPEEIVYAAGMIPFRITGECGASSIKSRAILFGNLCPYILSCLEEGMQDLYGFLDGAVIMNTCDARRRLYDAWRRYIKTSFTHLIDLPKVVTPESRDYFRKELLKFKMAMEKHFGCNITTDSLKEAISQCNTTRRLLKQLYELRKQRNVLISGSEVLAIMKASVSGNRTEFNKMLQALLELLEKETGHYPKNTGQSILITGSYFDHMNLIKVIEESGAQVVCEDLSMGIKYFEGEVDTTKEPFEALAEYYLGKAQCARMADSEKRFENIVTLVRDYHADSVIYFSLKFCDNNLIDFPYQKKRLNESGIPVLFLEGERTLVNIHQYKTRIQAFLEMSEAVV